MLRITMSIVLLMWVAGSLRCETSIMGPCQLTAQEISEYILERNPGFDPAIAEAYITLSERYGIRGDIALCQAIVETGWFRYEGSAVSPDQYNYCGLGVVANGTEGVGFTTVQEGVKAHLQHLFAYCCTRELPRRERLVDPRFALVSRGCATSWEGLGGRWAMNPRYGSMILDVYSRILDNRH